MKEQNPLGSGGCFGSDAAQSLAAGSGGKAADDPNAKDQASWQRDLLAWRAQRATNLQAPRAGFPWSPSVGCRKATTLRFRRRQPRSDRGQAPAHIAVVHLEKGALRLLPPSEVSQRSPVRRPTAKEQVLFADDADNPRSSRSHDHRHCDPPRRPIRPARQGPASPDPYAFHGLRWYEPNPPTAFMRAGFRTIRPKRSTFRPSSAPPHTCPPRRGRIHDRRKVVRLEPVLEDPKATDLFFILRDAPARPQPMARDVSSTPIFPTMA